MSYVYDYPRPAVTVDVALFAPHRDRLCVLLIRRKSAPFRDRWALPGGFLDPDEDLIDAARRELREETALSVSKLDELGAYGTPGRDPRGRTVSIVYLGLFATEPPLPEAGDDAAAARWRPALRPPPLAFDHDRILRDARARLRELSGDPDRLIKRLLPRRPAAARLDALLTLIEPRRGAVS